MKKNIIIVVIVLLIIGIAIIGNKLYVDKYNFTLKGSKTILLNIGDIWEDPGYVIDNNQKVDINNNIDYQKAGNYQVTYTFKFGLFKKELIRKIIVLNENEQTNFIINLKGSNPYYLMENNTYQEPGYEAFDTIDKDLTNKVQTQNNIGNTVGTYEVQYHVKNSDGITKTITRKVIIYNLEFNGKLENTNYTQNTNILLNITDSNYQYTILPNNEQTTNKEIIYPISENNDYVFKIYDNNNNYFEYIEKVKNIDNEEPSGTCTMSLANKGARIMVTAIDNSGIKGYVYQYGNNKTDILDNKEYSIITMDEKSSVTIYDLANNEKTINCNTIDNSTKYKRSYTLETIKTDRGYTSYYWLYQPKDNTARKKMPLLVYFHGDGGRKSTSHVNNYAFPKFVNDGMDFPFYMIAPYCSNEADFSSEGVMKTTIKIIQEISSKYNIDTDRIIISGGSSGARGAYTIAATYQDIFSCVVIGSGITYGLNQVENKLTYLPMWIFHGKTDSAIPISYVESHVKTINGLGGNVKFSAIDGGHEITETVFKYPELIDWMVSQRKSNNKKIKTS